MTITNYLLLFTIEFQHEYFNRNNTYDDSLNDLIIEPDDLTNQLLANYRMQYRIDKNKLLCFVPTRVEIDETVTPPVITITDFPLIDLKEQDKLRFKINVNDARFLNYTSLKIFDITNKIYRLGNDSGNKVNTDYFLSKSIPAYNSQDSYEMGTLVTQGGAGHTFEAIQYSDASLPAGTGDNNFWNSETNFAQFVNQADLVDDVDEINCLGFVEISFKSNLSNDFSLLQNNGRIRPGGHAYLIHFKNRSTYWNYQLKTAGVVTDTNGTITFQPSIADVSISSVKPVGLRLVGLSKNILNGDSSKVLPGAGTNIINFNPPSPANKSKIISVIKVNN